MLEAAYLLKERPLLAISTNRAERARPELCEPKYRYRATVTSCGYSSCLTTLGHPGLRRCVPRLATARLSRDGLVFGVVETPDRNGSCGRLRRAAAQPGSSHPSER